MYGLFTKMGAGAVISAGLSVLGVSYLCTDGASNHDARNAPAVVAVQADAALAAGVATSPSSHGPGGNAGAPTNPGSNSAGSSNPGSTNNPGPSSNPGSPSHPAPDCGCGATNPSLVTVKPDVDVDVDVVVTLPDTDVDAPGLVGGVLGTVGTVVHGVLPDCGCTTSGSPALLPGLGH